MFGGIQSERLSCLAESSPSGCHVWNNSSSNLASGQHRKIAAPDVISTKESTVVAKMRGQPVVYDLGLATSTFIAWPRPRWRPVHMRRGIETTSQAAPAYSRGPGAGVGKRARPR